MWHRLAERLYPIFDSLRMIRETGIMFFKDLRTHCGVRRENVVPEYALQISDYMFLLLTYG